MNLILINKNKIHLLEMNRVQQFSKVQRRSIVEQVCVKKITESHQVKNLMQKAKKLYKAKVAKEVRVLNQVFSTMEFLKIMIGRQRQFTDSLYFMNPKKNPLRILKSCGE